MSTKRFNTALKIDLGARASKLSLVQVDEVVQAMRFYYPNLCFRCHVVATKGDVDLKSSLRTLEKTDFFTYELDQWLIEGKCRIAVHSAKDLPDPLPQDLSIVALTESLNKEDVVVFHPDQRIEDLPATITIATSSQNRENNVLQMWPKAKVVDLRGSIDQRLEHVFQKKVDGVVIAKVALMRLGYNHLNMVSLKGPTTQGQGALAVVARKNDKEMHHLFKVIDSRCNEASLHTGLRKHHFKSRGAVTHCPIIQIKPLMKQASLFFKEALQKADFLLITSQTTVEILKKLIHPNELHPDVKVVCVGQQTARAVQKWGLHASYVANEASQEGMIELIKRIPSLKLKRFVYPKSAQARPKLLDFFHQNNIRLQAFDLYETQANLKAFPIALESYKEVVFTSSSGVKSFFENQPVVPAHLRFVCIGLPTQTALKSYLKPSIQSQIVLVSS